MGWITGKASFIYICRGSSRGETEIINAVPQGSSMDSIMGLIIAFMIAAIFIKVGIGAIMWLGPLGCLLVLFVLLLGR